MISIEAHRAAIGRFSRKARSITQIDACSKAQWIDTILLIFLTTLFQLISYGLVLTTIHVFFDYTIALSIVAIAYGWSYLIVKGICNLLCITIRNMSKRNKLMKNHLPQQENKVDPLIPCNYLDTFVSDGRCKYLDANFVLDNGDWVDRPNRIKCRKLMISIHSFTSCISCLLCYLYNIVICSSCLYIGINLLSRMNNINCGLHDLELYNVSFLKLSQLLLDGDVESNPGPMKKKIKKFQFQTQEIKFHSCC